MIDRLDVVEHFVSQIPDKFHEWSDGSCITQYGPWLVAWDSEDNPIVTGYTDELWQDCLDQPAELWALWESCTLCDYPDFPLESLEDLEI